ncbi:LAQU0S02e03598g1_1 [Lachancea quebecensis]|uniref:LAQU0S02e03598g1_1 n=1 Tax=Lachancea quebecensis TaxID=1654605 RepID=A0A0P1KP58_9SACH|nr:LAQU0S02e03598g1_1 [Lachancea quebecensis]
MTKHLLPPEVEEYRTVFEQTQIESIRLLAKKGPTGRYDSKFGGEPYFPRDFQYPLDEDGKPMKLLAQVNFEDMPALKNYPKRGILQFYLTTNDVAYGLDYEPPHQQRYFRILYFEEVLRDEGKLVSDFSFLPAKKPNDEDFPVESESKITFTRQIELMTPFDYRFRETVPIPSAVWTFDVELKYEEMHDAFHHKVGGYGAFVQGDPRLESCTDYSSYTHLLFQIASDDDIDCCWGDGGVANFFITEEDLKNRFFDRVLYNWDCS